MMGDKKWCPQHGYPLPCDKCGMPLPAKTLKELIDDRILDLRLTADNPVFSDGYRREALGGVRELEWVKRMMKDAGT